MIASFAAMTSRTTKPCICGHATKSHRGGRYTGPCRECTCQAYQRQQAEEPTA